MIVKFLFAWDKVGERLVVCNLVNNRNEAVRLYKNAKKDVPVNFDDLEWFYSEFNLAESTPFTVEEGDI